MALSFYDIDKEYVKYLQEGERNERGFTRVPNIEYPRNLPKFTCGVVLDVHGYKYYVPVSSYKMQKPPGATNTERLSHRFSLTRLLRL